jgi:hypothetical protein
VGLLANRLGACRQYFTKDCEGLDEELVVKILDLEQLLAGELDLLKLFIVDLALA